MAVETDPKQGCFLKEDRYLLLKRSDIEKYLTDDEYHQLLSLSYKVDAGRIASGKRSLIGVVVEDDWPMYDSTWKAIETWHGKQDVFRRTGKDADIGRF